MRIIVPKRFHAPHSCQALPCAHPFHSFAFVRVILAQRDHPLAGHAAPDGGVVGWWGGAVTFCIDFYSTFFRDAFCVPSRFVCFWCWRQYGARAVVKF